MSLLLNTVEVTGPRRGSGQMHTYLCIKTVPAEKENLGLSLCEYDAI